MNHRENELQSKVPDSSPLLNYDNSRRGQQPYLPHPPPNYNTMPPSNDVGPPPPGRDGLIGAAAKYRAANIMATHIRNERDLQVAKLNSEAKIAEEAEGRALSNLSVAMRVPGGGGGGGGSGGAGRPEENPFDVARACLNLRSEQDAMYNPMMNYGRYPPPPPGAANYATPGLLPGSELSTRILPNGSLMHGAYAPQHLQHNSHGRMPYIPPQMFMNGHGGGKNKRKLNHGMLSEGDYTKAMKASFGGGDPSSLSMNLGSMKPQDNKKGKRSADMPRRPLSAYNFFFSEERERVLASIPDPDAKKDESSEKDSEDKEKESENKEEESENKESDETSGKEDNEETPTKDESETSKDTTSTTTPTPKKTLDAKANSERLLGLRNVKDQVRRPHRKTHGKIGFQQLAKLIGIRWRALSTEEKEPYKELAKTDLTRYKQQMEEYNRKTKWVVMNNDSNRQGGGGGESDPL